MCRIIIHYCGSGTLNGPFLGGTIWAGFGIKGYGSVMTGRGIVSEKKMKGDDVEN